MTAITAREFNRDVSAAKRAALDEPVLITNRGNPEFVLISIEEYRKIRGDRPAKSLLDRLSMDEEIDFEPPRLQEITREVQW